MKRVLLVGGGRWARVYLSVIEEIEEPLELYVISRLNKPKILDLAKSLKT